MTRRGVVVLVGVVLALAAGCGSDEPADGFEVVAEGDTYGEWALSVEHEDGAWTGCMRMDYDDAGPMCDDPDQAFVRFEDWTGAQYGAVAEGEAARFVDGDEIELIDDRFFVVIEGPDVELVP